MEVLGSSRAVAKTEVHSFDNLRLWHIISGWLIVSIVKLKESLDTARGVLWASTVISVRQEHDETGFDIPFGLGRSHELVNHDLSSVSEITKLGLPKHKSRWIGLRVAELVTEDGVLGEVRV